MPKIIYGRNFWIGEKVTFQRSGNSSLVSNRLEFDSFTWHYDIIKKWPMAKRSWQEVITTLEKNQQFEEVLKWVPKYSINFGADSFLTEIGNQYWLKKDVTKAVSYFHSAYTGSPRDYNILKYYGFYLAKAGKKDEGIKHLRTATEIQPENFEAFYQLSHTLIEAGKGADAVLVLKRTLELNPNLADLKAALRQLERTPANQ